MIIREIHIDGFGIFNGYSLTNLDKGVNIIQGHNEAGKSTLLKFLRYTLFGYPRLLDQRMAPLNGGAHGGRVKALLSSGEEVVFERYGNDKGNFYLHGQASQNQSAWFQLLGNASSDLYNNVYAFSLDELVDMRSLSASGVEDRIFSVGLGLGNTSLGQVEDELQNRIERIYKPRGSSQQVPKILLAMKERRNRIRHIQENLPAYEALHKELQGLDEELHRVQRQLGVLRAEKARTENYLRCYDAYVNAMNARDDMRALPALRDFPEGALMRLAKAEDRERDHLDAIKQLREGGREETGMVELRTMIDEMDYSQDLLAMEDDVNYLHSNLSRYGQAASDTLEEQQQMAVLMRSIDHEIKAISSTWSEEQVRGFVNLAVRRDKIEQFKNEMDHLARERIDAESAIRASRAGEGVIHANRMMLAASLIILIGAAPSFYYDLPALGIALTAMAAVLFFGRRFLIKSDAMASLLDRLSGLEKEDELLKQQYQEYLVQELRLPGSLMPETVLEVLQKIGQINKDMTARDQLKQKIETQRLPFLRSFEEKVSGFAGIIGSDLSSQHTEVSVKQILDAYRTAKERFDQKERLTAELKRKQSALALHEEQLGQWQAEIDALLEMTGAGNRDDFRKMVAENEKVKACMEKEKAALELMEQIVGRGKSKEVTDFLDQHDKLLVEQKIGGLEESVAENAEAYANMNKRLGELQNELRRMEGESDLAPLLTEQETARQQLRKAYGEWLTGQVAIHVLSKVRASYEKNKQPEVVKQAGHYFRLITGGQYSNIRVALDSGEVAVFDAREASKKIDQLSRGTREQLLISLRLGFIEGYEKQSEPLPVIVDEVLVNFDPDRAQHTANILQEFAKNRQVLLFTCRPETITYFGGEPAVVLGGGH